MKRRSGRWLIGLGLLLLSAALLLIVYNTVEAARAGKTAQKTAEELETLVDGAEEHAANQGEIPDYLLAPEREMPVQTIDGYDYIGMLTFPSLGQKLPVMSRWSSARLKLAPCRYGGSAYTNDLIIAAHNYPAHFGQLSALGTGDAVWFTDVDGNVFRYEVAGRETLPPTAVEEMESGDWDLTLFTCTVGGQSRVTVRCLLTGE